MLVEEPGRGGHHSLGGWHLRARRAGAGVQIRPDVGLAAAAGKASPRRSVPGLVAAAAKQHLSGGGTHVLLAARPNQLRPWHVPAWQAAGAGPV